MRQRLPDIIAVAALIGATAFPLIWTGLAMRERPLLPVRASASISPAITVSRSAPSSSRYASKLASDVTTDPRKLKHQSAVEIESENIDRKSMASRSILPLPD